MFKPHAVNLQRGELRISRSEVSHVVSVRTFGLIPNGLAVTLKSGEIETLVVNGRDMWARKLTS